MKALPALTISIPTFLIFDNRVHDECESRGYAVDRNLVDLDSQMVHTLPNNTVNNPKKKNLHPAVHMYRHEIKNQMSVQVRSNSVDHI